MEITEIWRGIDTLDVSFKGAISGRARKALSDAKARASSRGDGNGEYLEIGGIAGIVGETGAKGGYAFRFDTGPDGEIWTIKDNPDCDQWNIRVQVRSARIAVDGYHETVEHLFRTLRAWDAQIITESVSRIDFAVDFVAPDFELDPMCFVHHSHATLGEGHDDPEEMPFGVRRVGRKPNSVTIGKQPGRQVIVYDKRREQAYKAHTHWYEVWGVTREGCPHIWRIELRAGKKHLKDWRITTFDDLEERGGDMFASAVQSVRMLVREPAEGDTVTRIPPHPVWEWMAGIVDEYLGGWVSGVERGRIVEGRREDIQAIYRRQITGLATSYAVALGVTLEEAGEEVSGLLKQDFRAYALGDPSTFARKFNGAAKRLHFLDEGDSKNGRRETENHSGLYERRTEGAGRWESPGGLSVSAG
ncbi:MAG: hypothetical protein ACPGO3_13245 [Magnetospiraceae bacterium]